MTERQTEERRRFRRLVFDAPAHITGPDISADSRLIDISLKGALLSLPEDHTLEVGTPLEVEVVLDDGKVSIHMKTVIAHVQTGRIGLQCIHIDVESISRLRRLIELNLDDDELLQRELVALG
ncbi:MAG: PilZ domain-containing protein [Sedimenticola sp.]